MNKNTKPKILLVGPSPRAQGGIAALMGTYLKSGLVRECDVLPVFTRLEGSKWLKAKMLAQAISRFLWLSFIHRPKICHIHFCSRVSFYRKSMFLIGAKILGQRIVFHGHGGSFQSFFARSGKLSKIYIRKILSAADLIAVGSEHAKNVMAHITDRSDVRIVSNSIANERIVGLAHDGQKFRNTENFSLLFLGRIERAKGVYELIDAAGILKEKTSGIKIIFGGDGDIENARKICRENDVEDMVHFFGWVEGDDKIQLFKEADCYVLPSYRELQSVSVLEALAAGLPIVATDISGINEMVENGVNGCLVPVGDPLQLAEKIFLLSQDKKLRQQMSETNCRKFKNLYDIKFVVQNLAHIYQNLIFDPKKNHVPHSWFNALFTRLRARGIL